METFGAELRRAREERKISLLQIAETTLINIKFLEAIERGEMSLLPQAYVRAFIREYASVIGLDPAEVMRRYDEASHPAEEKSHPEPLPAAPPTPVIGTPQGSQRSPAFPKSLQNVLLVVGALAIAGVALWLRNSDSATQQEEIPFQNMVQEAESRAAPATPPSPQRNTAVARNDSLVLLATTTDSVWIQITIDSEPAKDYLFPPNMKRSWKAKDKFTVTLGNAGGVTFTLNGTPIAALGKRGAVVRNVEISPRISPLQ